MLSVAGGTQSIEESGGPESRSRRQLPGSPGVLGKSRQSRPLLCSLIRTQPKGSQERKIEVPPKLASFQRDSGCAGPGTFAGREEPSRGTFMQRDRTLGPHSTQTHCLFSLRALSCPRPSLPSSQGASSVLPAHPRGGGGRGSSLAAHFGSVSWVAYQGHWVDLLVLGCLPSPVEVRGRLHLGGWEGLWKCHATGGKQGESRLGRQGRTAVGFLPGQCPAALDPRRRGRHGNL